MRVPTPLTLAPASWVARQERERRGECCHHITRDEPGADETGRPAVHPRRGGRGLERRAPACGERGHHPGEHVAGAGAREQRRPGRVQGDPPTRPLRAGSAITVVGPLQEHDGTGARGKVASRGDPIVAHG